MKILLIQEKGRHDKNRKFRECEVMKKSLTDLGINSTIWGLNYENFKVPFEEIVEDKDVIFSIENYDSGWVPNLSKYKEKLKIFWSVDSHCALRSHLKVVIENKFDIVLNSIDSHQFHFNKFLKTYYFPNAYPDYLIYPKKEIKKEYDVGFCGSIIADRKQWLSLISSRFNLKQDIFVLGDDMVNAINSYKICFNKTLADDINYRFFETLGCETALITNCPPGADSLFEDQKHLIYYKNHLDLTDKIQYYLNNENELFEIAKSGHTLVKEKHTYANRAKYLLEIINENS